MVVTAAFWSTGAGVAFELGTGVTPRSLLIPDLAKPPAAAATFGKAPEVEPGCS